MDGDIKGKKADICLCEDSSASGNESLSSCSQSKEYLTADEEELLSQIRALWKESRKIKSRIKDLDSAINRGRTEKDTTDDRRAQGLKGVDRELILHERRKCIQRLKELRTKRKRLERAREEANRRKMIFLGHAT